MAIKTLRYTVSEDGISPAIERSAGMQYDHKKTQLQFSLNKELYDSLLTEIENGNIIYRFDCYDGENMIHRSDFMQLNDMTLEPYLLEYSVTKFGGKIRVCLVITTSKDGYTDTENYIGNAVVYLKNLPESADNSNEYKSMSTLAENAENNANTAISAMETANKALEEIKELKLALDNAEWVFDGNESKTEIDVNFIVENELRKNSKNAISNGVVTEKFEKLYDDFTKIKEGLSWQTVDELVDVIKEQIFLEAHPVGSYYWSADPISPSKLFGGSWKEIKNVFLFAAGEDYSVGSTGGEREHKLSLEEMPLHTHKFWSNKDGIDTNSIITYDSIGYVHSAKLTPNGKSVSTKSNGSSLAHNNMPPYLVAYCWQRIEEGSE